MSRLSGPFSPPPLTVKQRVKRDTLAEAREKRYVRERDRGCVAAKILPASYQTEPGPTGITVTVHESPCEGRIEVDHVRASGGLGLKSETHRRNMVSLCLWHHKLKTEYGKVWRPLLIDYLDRVEGPAT